MKLSNTCEGEQMNIEGKKSFPSVVNKICLAIYIYIYIYIYRTRQKKCIHTLTKDNSMLYNRLF